MNPGQLGPKASMLIVLIVLTLFASLPHEVRRALADVRLEEGVALATVLTLLLLATPTFESGHASDDFDIFGIVARGADVLCDPSRVLGLTDEVLEGVPVDDESLDGSIQTLDDSRVFVQRVGKSRK